MYLQIHVSLHGLFQNKLNVFKAKALSKIEALGKPPDNTRYCMSSHTDSYDIMLRHISIKLHFHVVITPHRNMYVLLTIYERRFCI